MKRICLTLLVLLCLSLLNAVPQYLIGISAPPDKDNGALRTYVQSLANQGLEVYYYNENQIIAGSNTLDVSGAKLLRTTIGQNLYLVSKHSKYKDVEIGKIAEVLLDLGTQVLIGTPLNEVELRALIRSPFTPLVKTPMELSASSFLLDNVADTRTSIETMISQVSVDSVAGFIQSLQNMQTRYALADNRLAVANWIKAQFTRFGIASELHTFQWQNTTQYNVVATIPGTVYPDTYIVVGGHHDSTSSPSPTTFAPGADDNASGTVAAIEIARVMMTTGFQPKCSIRFVTFAAEEFGLWGSKAYALMAQNTGMDIRLMVNHDMIANTNPNPDDPRVLLMPYDGFMQHTDHAAALTTQYTTLQPVYGSMNLSGSDSYSFWQRGFPVVYFFEYNFSQVYHSNNDTMANINPTYAANVIRASVAVSASFANMPSAPSNLQVLDSGTGNSLGLFWEAVNDPAFSHYKVYWGPEPGVYPNSQTTTNISFTINGLAEAQTYYVAISTIDTSGNESYRVTGSGMPRLIPLTPADFVDAPVHNAINLSWTPNSEMDLASYKLYRSLDPALQGELIATLPPQADSFADTNLTGTLAYYCYRLCAVDSSGYQSLFTEMLQSRPVSLDMGILVVDETKNFTGSNPFQPTDLMVDGFYANVTQNLSVTTTLDLEDGLPTLRLADLGIYSSILWHGNDYSDVTYPAGIKSALKEYISQGGNILFSVYQPSQAFELNAGYPAVFGASTFINEVLGISGVDYEAAARFKYAIPQLNPYPAMQVDSLKTPSSFNGHIFRVEGLVPVDEATALYTYGSDYASTTNQGSMNGEKVGIYHQYGAGKAVTLSFPLYHMQEQSSRMLVQHVFGQVFGEPVPVTDEHSPALDKLTLEQNYPNPFSSISYIPYKTAGSLFPLKLQIYNLKGQLVKTLLNEIPAKSGTLQWDGKDQAGRPAANGIYYIKAMHNGAVSTRKIVLLK